MRQPMALNNAVAAARLWRAADLCEEVEIGALEPLLWHEGGLLPADLVRALKAETKVVTMTTNGSRLAEHARGLADAGLDLLRVSWHTTEPALFAEISGHGVYEEFYAGVTAAAETGLRLSFNRVLFRNHVDDLPEQIAFIRKHNCRLKLYDLMWTPELSDVYGDIYQDWRPVVRRYILPVTERTEIIPMIGRKRVRFWLYGGGCVEVKFDSSAKSATPCATCSFRSVCIEEFGDYVRVEPELDAYFCYLRRDISLDLRRCVHEQQLGQRLLSMLNERVPGRGVEIARYTPLRLIVVPYCNFNCFVPGTNISWCHKTTGDFTYPGRPGSAKRIA